MKQQVVQSDLPQGFFPLVRRKYMNESALLIYDLDNHFVGLCTTLVRYLRYLLSCIITSHACIPGNLPSLRRH